MADINAVNVVNADNNTLVINTEYEYGIIDEIFIHYKYKSIGYLITWDKISYIGSIIQHIRS